MNENIERDFKGVWISKEIWLNEQLNALDKIVLAEIDSLDVGEDGCFASNEYLANFCKCSAKSISRSVTKLMECGYIELISFDGRHRRIHSRLDKMSRQTGQNVHADRTKCPAINIDNNIDNNKENIKREKTKFLKPTLEEIKEYIEDKGLNVNANDFFQYFEEGNWIDSKGNKVKNWKQKLLTWNKYKSGNKNYTNQQKQSFNKEINNDILEGLYDNM